MGDRANIYVVDQTDAPVGIYLYTHWNGSEWPEMLRNALVEGKYRWQDDSYLTRIVVSHIYADIHGQETGGGISTIITDNEYPIIILDHVNQQVAFAKEGEEKSPSKWYGKMPFQTYVAQKRATYPYTGS